MNNERKIKDFWNKSGKGNSMLNIKRSLDALDTEAEREGKARRFFTSNDLKPILGRRVGKETRKHDGYTKTAGFKATRNLVKDTVKVYRDITKNPSI